MKPANTGSPSAEDKALDLFAEMMIDKINSLTSKDGWKKPWFSGDTLLWPKNVSGREYNGMNAMMLMMLCEEKGYKIPRFCTFDYVQRLNNETIEEHPRVLIAKGEKSFPVMLTTFTCVNPATKERIRWDDYKNLSDEEKKKFVTFPRMKVFHVFNVAQTNLQQSRPDLWEKLEQESTIAPRENKGDGYSFEPMDVMIRDNRWICPIRPVRGDSAYYSIDRDEIVIPEREQFDNGEAFYGNLFHEMGHSTGADAHLKRLKPATFGSKEYAREELVAELTAALTAQRYGMTKNLKKDSAAYLKSWLDALKESPQFIKTTLVDVKKATAMLTQRIDGIAQEIKEGRVNGCDVGADMPKEAETSQEQSEHEEQSVQPVKEEEQEERVARSGFHR